MNLSLGPLLYYWSRDDVLSFYDQAALWPVERVYLGESVCSRRHVLRLPDWLALAEALAAAGKEVVLSSQTLIESESDLKTLRRIASNGRFRVEANEWGAVRLLAEAGVPFVAGPTLNVYNHETLDLLAGLGAERWLPPVEMSRTMLAAVLAQAAHPLPAPPSGEVSRRLDCGSGALAAIAPTASPVIDRPEHPDGDKGGAPTDWCTRSQAHIETEVFAYGKLPLAYSARCFTARHYNLPKDDCQFRCLDHPDGLSLATREGTPFLTINGIQTQSAGVYNLIGELPALRALGIASLRLSPQSRHMGRVVEAFHQALQGDALPADLARLMPGPPVDGYWHGRAGLTYGER